MNVTEFRHNMKDVLKGVVNSGQPDVVTWHRPRTPYVTLVPPELYDELIEAAGERGQEILDRHREAAEQQKQEAA